MSISTAQIMSVLGRPATSEVHSMRWKLALVILFFAFAGCDIAAVGWAAGMVTGGLLVVGSFSFAMIATFVLFTVWSMETQ
jgi:hypothetical protein